MGKKRYVVLDALRGFAILGICLANFPEFSLWTFSDSSTWTMTDKVIRAIQTFLVDGSPANFRGGAIRGACIV